MKKKLGKRAWLIKAGRWQETIWYNTRVLSLIWREYEKISQKALADDVAFIDGVVGDR